MLPLYFAAAGVSWLLAGDFGAWNVFERRAGLADGGYADRPLRPGLRQLRPVWRARRASPYRPRNLAAPGSHGGPACSGSTSCRCCGGCRIRAGASPRACCGRTGWCGRAPGSTASRRCCVTGSGLADPEYRVPLPPELFGEGICRVGGDLWQLTWQERVALRWQADTLDPAGSVPFNREGWGICSAGDQVLTSDGTSELVRRDPATLAPARPDPGPPGRQRVGGLNDLDCLGRAGMGQPGRAAVPGRDRPGDRRGHRHRRRGRGVGADPRRPAGHRKRHRRAARAWGAGEAGASRSSCSRARAGASSITSA